MAALPLSPCACFNARRAARAITDLYDSALEPSGLRMTQAAILVAVKARGSTTIKNLAADLGLDASTMTRTLAPLFDLDLLASRPGADRRARELELTPAGESKLAECYGLWKGVQEDLEQRLGTDRFERMIADMTAVTEELRDV